MVIIEFMNRVLIIVNIRWVCFEVVVRYDYKYVGIVENNVYSCWYFGIVMRIKEVLVEEILCYIVRKLGLEICKGILMYIESVV